MSALTARGSTRRWRRIRVLVLGRDSSTCQVPGKDGPPPGPGSWAQARGHRHVCGRYATHVDHAEATRRNMRPDAVDNLDDLRATCAAHNLSKGAKSAAEFDNQAATPAAALTRWEW